MFDAELSYGPFLSPTVAIPLSSESVHVEVPPTILQINGDGKPLKVAAETAETPSNSKEIELGKYMLNGYEIPFLV
jgi:hypothetical protein